MKPAILLLTRAWYDVRSPAALATRGFPQSRGNFRGIHLASPVEPVLPSEFGIEGEAGGSFGLKQNLSVVDANR
jgi:hypothetical protein